MLLQISLYLFILICQRKVRAVTLYVEQTIIALSRGRII